MNELIEFATSTEMIVVGSIVVVFSFLAVIGFFIEKSYMKRKQRKNTKEIHEIVEDEQNNSVVLEQKEVIPITNQTEQELIEGDVDLGIKEEMIEELEIKTEMEKPLVIPIEEFQQQVHSFEELEKKEELHDPIMELLEPKEEKNSIESIYNEVKEEVEQLQYTDVEPNKEEAKEELRRATEELIKQEQMIKEDPIDLTKFEEEQEENAIISLDELMKKSEVLYQQNETTQYQDEGNEPISLEDLEQRMKNIKVEIEQLEQDQDQLDSKTSQESIATSIELEEKTLVMPRVRLDDLNTIDSSPKAYREDVVFKSSPIISPIFGIEEKKNESNLELENTANYDKLDEEIKKTNQFIATLKELQHKLD